MLGGKKDSNLSPSGLEKGLLLCCKAYPYVDIFLSFYEVHLTILKVENYQLCLGPGKEHLDLKR